jgi:hypothetical protein
MSPLTASQKISTSSTSAASSQKGESLESLRERAHQKKLQMSMPAGVSYNDFLVENVKEMNDDQMARWMALLRADKTGGAEAVLVFCAIVHKQNRAALQRRRRNAAIGSEEADLSSSEAQILRERREKMHRDLRALLP